MKKNTNVIFYLMITCLFVLSNNIVSKGKIEKVNSIGELIY